MLPYAARIIIKLCSLKLFILLAYTPLKATETDDFYGSQRLQVGSTLGKGNLSYELPPHTIINPQVVNPFISSVNLLSESDVVSINEHAFMAPIERFLDSLFSQPSLSEPPKTISSRKSLRSQRNHDSHLENKSLFKSSQGLVNITCDDYLRHTEKNIYLREQSQILLRGFEKCLHNGTAEPLNIILSFLSYFQQREMRLDCHPFLVIDESEDVKFLGIVHFNRRRGVLYYSHEAPPSLPSYFYPYQVWTKTFFLFNCYNLHEVGKYVRKADITSDCVNFKNSLEAPEGSKVASRIHSGFRKRLRKR